VTGAFHGLDEVVSQRTVTAHDEPQELLPMTFYLPNNDVRPTGNEALEFIDSPTFVEPRPEPLTAPAPTISLRVRETDGDRGVAHAEGPNSDDEGRGSLLGETLARYLRRDHRRRVR